MISTKKNTKYKEQWIEKIFSIKIGSYIHDDTQIRFTGSFAHDAENQRAQQYELVAKELDYNDTFIIHANRFDTQHSAPLTKQSLNLELWWEYH